MQPNLTMVLEQVGKDKGIDVKILLQTLEQAILTAAKKVFGMHRELFARTTGDTFDPITPGAVAADVTIGFVLQTMDLGGYRHIPIVNSANIAVGIISSRDILRFMAVKYAQSRG